MAADGCASLLILKETLMRLSVRLLPVVLASILIGPEIGASSSHQQLTSSANQRAGARIRQLVSEHRWPELEALMAPIAAAGDRPQASYLLAVSMVRQGRLAEALGHFEAAVKVGSRAPALWLREYSNALLTLQRCQRAIPVLDTLVDREREPADLLNRAVCLQQSGELERSRRDLEWLLEMVPNHHRGLVELSELHRKLGDEVEACRVFEVLSREHPNDPAGSVGRAGCHIDRMELERGEKLLRSALEDYPHHPESLARLGRLLVDTGRHEEGRAVLRRFQEVSVTLDAVEMLESFLQQKPSDRASIKTLIEKLERLGRPYEAQRWRARLADEG